MINLIRREIMGRYRGSALGIFWSLLTPLFMLGVFTFIFGSVFKSRWGGASESTSMAEFAIILFAGLIIFQLFAEVINKAPKLVLSNVNYVKKVVFPLEILVPVSLGAALFHMVVSLFIIIIFMIYIYGSISLTALLVPIIILPFCILILGLAWILASVGVFLRDIHQIIGTLVTALMFLSGIFFPISSLPPHFAFWIHLSPIAFPIEQFRNVLIFGKLPDFWGLLIYYLIAVIIALSGYWWFQRTKKGFADVL